MSAYALGKPITPILQFGHPLTRGLVLGLLMCDQGGPVAADSSGSGNNGPLVPASTWSDGQNGRCLSFTGAGSASVNCGTSAASNDFSAAVWARQSVATLNKALVGKNNSANSSLDWTYKTTLGAPVQMRGIVSFSGGSTTVTDPATLDANWHHWVLTCSGTAVTLYKDGVAVGTAVGSGTRTAFNTNVWVGDQTNNNAPWVGQVDIVLVYNRGLFVAEVAQLCADSWQMCRVRPRRPRVTGAPPPPAVATPAVMLAHL